MRFKVKVVTPQGKEHIEYNNAVDKNKLQGLYDMMGYQLIEILETEKETSMFEGLDPETMAKIQNMGGGGVPNMGAIAIPQQPQQPQQPKYKEYTDNNINYRVELNSGVLQKQDWVKLNNDELKDISIEDDNKMVSAYTKKMKLYRLKWVDLG